MNFILNMICTLHRQYSIIISMTNSYCFHIYNIITIISILLCFDFILKIESSSGNKFHHPLLLTKKYEDNYVQHQIQINDLSNLLKDRLNVINRNRNNETNNNLNASKIVLKRSPGQSHCPRSHDYKDGCLQIDFSQFNKVLSIESVESSKIPRSWLRYISTKHECFVANVQAMVNMEDFVDNILPLGYIPAVVPEFKGITVGGSIQGLAAESTSFKCGLFHDVVLEFEAILSNGTILTCNRHINSELFYSLPGSFGSLAICTSAKVLCIPASPFIQINTKSHRTHKECIAYMMKYVSQSSKKMIDGDNEDNNRSIDFLEGIGFSEQQFVSIKGRFVPINHMNTNNSGSNSVNNKDYKPLLLRCAGWGAPWFFNIIRHRANKISDNNNKKKNITSTTSNNNSNDNSTYSLHHQKHQLGTECDNSVFLLSTKDYLFRYDRGSFWMASYRIPQIIGKYLDPWLDSSNMFKLATALPWAFPKQTIVLQDFMLPECKVDSFIQQMQEGLQVWPIWLLPMYNTYHSENNCDRRSYCTDTMNKVLQRTMNPYPTISTSSACTYPIFSVSEENLVSGSHFCNVGAYGIPKLKYNFMSSNHKLEKLLYLHQGRKVYYSHAFYDKSFFYNTLYNGQRYFDMRKKYSADGFHEIYDKIVTKNGKL